MSLDPSGPILSQLASQGTSDRVVEISAQAGLSFDLSLTDRESYSNSTRIRAYLIRAKAALIAMGADDRARVLSNLVAGLLEAGVDETELAVRLKSVGWHVKSGQLTPVDSRQQPRDDGGRTAVVLTALPLETAAVLEHLADVKEETTRKTVYSVGTFAGSSDWRVAVLTAGMGNPGAAVELDRAIAAYNPDCVLLVGVGGGVKDVNLGDVVAADKVYSYEGGKAGESFAPRPDAWHAGYGVLQRARQEARKGAWVARIKGTKGRAGAMPKAIVKPIAAGEKVIAAQASGIFELIRTNYGDAAVVDMEGAGFHIASHVNTGVEALVIRGVSDLIDDKAKSDADGWQETAARHAAAFAFECLDQLNAPSSADKEESRPQSRGRVSETGPSSEPGVEATADYRPERSTAMFEERMASAFPGARGVVEEADPTAAIERLGRLLRSPLGGRFGSPIWEVGMGTTPIHEFRSGEGNLAYMDRARYRVHRIVGYRSRFYKRNFVLLEWAADEPCGLYQPLTREEIAEHVQATGRCTEEYGVWNDQLVTRAEFDDGAIFRHGKLQEIDADLEVRQLAGGATFIVPQLSAVNDLENDGARFDILRRYTSGQTSIDEIVSWVESLPGHRRDTG